MACEAWCGRVTPVGNWKSSVAMGDVRAIIVVGNWKGGVAEKYHFCWMRRTEAERREHSQRESYFIRGIGANMSFGPIQCLVSTIFITLTDAA